MLVNCSYQFNEAGKLFISFFSKSGVIERRYCLIWITHYDVLQFLRILQLRYMVSE